MAKDELLVIDKTYELLKWFLGRLEKFPRSHRYGLGQRLETRLYEVFEALVHAKYGGAQAKLEQLALVNRKLEVVRMFSRLSHDLGFLPNKSYEYAAREVNEIGRMVGGWQRQQQRKQSSSTG